MFSYPALFVKGNMFAFTFGPKIAVRADEATRAKPGMKRFEPMPGRPMGEYVEVPAKDMTAPALKRWMSSALAYADTLEPKAKKSAAKKAATKQGALKNGTTNKGAKK
jgi:hypothetical protein